MDISLDISLHLLNSVEFVESSGKIHMHAFKIAIGVLTGLALCSFITRVVIRLKYQSLRLDDAFLIIAAASLCAATGIIYHICYSMYLHSAALLVPQALPYLLTRHDELLSFQKKACSYLVLIWTTTFAVKGCFLAFMRPLVWPISRAVNWYYWFIVALCVLSWVFIVTEPFIICPYFGPEGAKCFTSIIDEKTLGLTGLVTVLDVLSDIMIVSLPIIILRSLFLSRSTKFYLAIPLCPSVFMAICATIKIAGFHYKWIQDGTWEFFWKHAEGAVAVMMASIIAFRTLLIRQASKIDDTSYRSPLETPFLKLWRHLRSLAREQPDEKPASSPNTSIIKLPKMPSPVFTGLRTFIRRASRIDASTATLVTLDSVGDASEGDYHATLKIQNKAISSNTSTQG